MLCYHFRCFAAVLSVSKNLVFGFTSWPLCCHVWSYTAFLYFIQSLCLHWSSLHVFCTLVFLMSPDNLIWPHWHRFFLRTQTFLPLMSSDDHWASSFYSDLQWTQRSQKETGRKDSIGISRCYGYSPLVKGKEEFEVPLHVFLSGRRPYPSGQVQKYEPGMFSQPREQPWFQWAHSFTSAESKPMCLCFQFLLNAHLQRPLCFLETPWQEYSLNFLSKLQTIVF